jgi:very-short-patch-repair endonuclease
MKRKGSDLERLMAWQIKVAQLPEPIRELMFHPTRKWRADFAWPDHRVMLEVEGGVWVVGAHNRGAHFESDCEKYAEAALLGWTVIRATGRHVKNGTALLWLAKALQIKGDARTASGA